MQYVLPTDEQKEVMKIFRDKFDDLYQDVAALERSRGVSLALTKLEEASMWLNKAITKND